MTEETTSSEHNPTMNSAMPESAAKRRSNRKLAVVAAAVILSVVALATIPRLLIWNELEKEKQRQANSASNVFVTPAKASTPSIDLELSGTLSPITEAPILARCDGYLKKRLVDIGDHVHAGQLLGVIDAPDLDDQVAQALEMVDQSRSALQQSHAALEQANANAGIAKITADRWAALVRRGAVSRQASDNYQFAYSAQAAAVGEAEANLGAAANNVGSNEANFHRYRKLQEYEQIRAPFDGVVTERNVDDGALISAATTLMFRVAKNDILRTYIDVPQLNAPSIKVGDTVDLSFIQYPDRRFTGKVTRTASSLDLNTRTLLTEVDIDNQQGLLLPGMYVTVTFHLPRAVSAALIPAEALVFRGDGTSVAVVDDQNFVRYHKVTVGHDYGASIEIQSGLEPGEKVVVNPNDTTREGAKVKPIPIQKAVGSLAPASGTVTQNQGH